MRLFQSNKVIKDSATVVAEQVGPSYLDHTYQHMGLSFLE
jgi:hypothetical protein